MVKSTTQVRRSWQPKRCSGCHRGCRDGTKPVQEEPHATQSGAATWKPRQAPPGEALGLRTAQRKTDMRTWDKTWYLSEEVACAAKCSACARVLVAQCCTPFTASRVRFISFHFISFHFISFHFISFHFISFHFISFHFISFHFISFTFISFHFISFHFISFHFISFHFISFHFISFHFISFHFKCHTQARTARVRTV